MNDKFQNKYRIPSARLQNWDYASEGAYFITICTKDRIHFFGEIVNGKMNLSQVGVIADLMWYEIKNHAKNIELGEFVIMPNHIHGILILNGMDDVTNVTTDVVTDVVEKRHAFSLPVTIPATTPEPKTIGQQRFQNQGKNSISSIIGSYKSAVTKHTNRLEFKFAWQTSFYDHIIRDAQSFENIQNYIANNPANWGKDKFCSNE
jgi:REP element-mobilizing transposase RayT